MLDLFYNIFNFFIAQNTQGDRSTFKLLLLSLCLNARENIVSLKKIISSRPREENQAVCFILVILSLKMEFESSGNVCLKSASN